MKTKLLALALLAGGSMFAETRFSIGVNLGGYNGGYYEPGPPAYVAVRPPCPGPDYAWADGYWTQYGGHRGWHQGYWARRAYDDDYRSAPRYDGRYRDGEGRFERDHHFDRDRRVDRDDDRSRGYATATASEITNLNAMTSAEAGRAQGDRLRPAAKSRGGEK